MIGRQNPYLPPGCTDADVDRAAGSDEPPPQCKCEGPCDCDGPSPPPIEPRDPSLRAAVQVGRRRNLRDDPALLEIDQRIRSLEPIRAQFTNADRERWSILNDLHRELSSLMRVVQRATGRRP